MPKTKVQKNTILNSVKEKLANMKSVVFVNFSGIPVKEINVLRDKCKDNRVDYSVAKKTLLKKALAEQGYQKIDESVLSGEVAVLFSVDDEIVPAKLVSEFVKGNDKMKIVGGILEGNIINQDKIVALAKLPSRNELLAKAIGSLKSPLAGLVNVMSGNLRSLVYVLSAIKEKNFN
jgi:large subunit ribosomal protein L10